MRDKHSTDFSNKFDAINQYISKEKLVENAKANTHPIEIPKDIMSYLLDPKVGRLIYALRELQYTNKYLLKQLTGMNQSNIIHHMSKLENHNIFGKLKQNTKTYKILMSYWKSEFRNAWDSGTFFFINPEFEDVIIAFEDVLTSFFHVKEINNLTEQKQKWLSHKQHVENQNKAHERMIKNTIGTCCMCHKPITSEMKEGINYSCINGVLIHTSCFNSGTSGEISAALRNNKTIKSDESAAKIKQQI